MYRTPMPLLLLLCAPMAHAAQPAPQVDAELLEFLGSIDGDGDGWQEFLEQMPVKRKALPPSKQVSSTTVDVPPGARNTPPAPAASPPPAGNPDKAAQDAAKVKAK